MEILMRNDVVFQKWTPLESIPDRLYCEAIHDDYEGFRVLLKGEDATSPVLRIGFSSVLAYRKVDEGSLLRTLDLMKNLNKFPLYTVSNSPFVKWLHEESYGIYKDSETIHYAILTANDCIDVLTEDEPKVEWLDGP
jgi:hypothetical protein